MYQKIFVALEEFGTIIASEGHGYSGLSALKNSGFVTKPPFYFFPFPNPKRTIFFFDLDIFRFFLFSDFIFVFFSAQQRCQKVQSDTRIMSGSPS